MDFYIFEKNGNYIGMRGVAPTEADLVAIEATDANIAKMSVYVTPKLIDGKIVEAATPEEIEEANRPLVPTEVALWKLRFVLSQMGLEQSVTDAISNLPEPQRTAALYLWNGGLTVDRYSPTIELIKRYIGLNDRQVDDIFIQANSIIL